MSRTVSVPYNAKIVCYQDVSWMEDYVEWEDFLEEIQDRVMMNWPSFNPCDKWLDREDHAILQNDHCFVGVSEYCGLASIWVTMDPDYRTYQGLASNFIGQTGTNIPSKIFFSSEC